MFPKKSPGWISGSSASRIKSSILVILIVQIIAKTYSSPAIGRPSLHGPPAPYGYWGSKSPFPNMRLDKNPFDLSEEERFQDFTSSEETFDRSKERDKERDDVDDDDDDSDEKKNGRGDVGGYEHFNPYGYDPAIEQASVPELQNMLTILEQEVPQVSPSRWAFSFTPVFSHIFKKMYCWFQSHYPYCANDSLWMDDPWYEGFRSKKT